MSPTAPRPRTGSEPAKVPLYEELRSLAEDCFRGQPAGHTLEPAALVHEAYLRLGGDLDAFHDRAHFVAVAVRAMRQVLIDHARRSHTAKRGRGWHRVPLTEACAHDVPSEIDVLDLEAALDALAARDARKARVVALHFFGGLSFQEIADHLDVSRPTVERNWRYARVWLRRALGGAP